jgi:hypothetical protein
LQSSKEGILLYNGKPFSRSKASWDYRPPKFVRIQGRYAKEIPNPRNSFPKVIKVERGDNGKITVKRVRAVCRGTKGRACNEGAYRYDKRMYLYCYSCGLIYTRTHYVAESLPWASSAPRADHSFAAEKALEAKWDELGLKGQYVPISNNDGGLGLTGQIEGSPP